LLAKEKGLELVDLEKISNSSVLRDGIHPNEVSLCEMVQSAINITERHLQQQQQKVPRSKNSPQKSRSSAGEASPFSKLPSSTSSSESNTASALSFSLSSSLDTAIINSKAVGFTFPSSSSSSTGSQEKVELVSLAVTAAAAATTAGAAALVAANAAVAAANAATVAAKAASVVG
jgi:hypothetical protein